eukprot:SAG22_NODE_14729_length_366_cov_1.730337_1_plen_109_part_10
MRFRCHRIRDQDREKLERIFDEIDTDGDFGISYDEFASYVNRRYSTLPALAAGSYALGERILAIGPEGALTITAPVRQRSSLLKAVITAFPSVSLPFFAVPLRSHRTVA